MLLEMAVGDAYGAKFESIMELDLIQRNNDFSYGWQITEDFQPSLMPPGHYTDDTQMALAISEAMLNPEESWSDESLAEWFVEVFHRNPRRGYTTFFLNVLMNSEDGKELLSRINAKSTKSGAAMRSAPLGLYEKRGEVIAKAKTQAAVTHNTWQGRESAIAVALSSWYFYHQHGPREDLVKFLNETRFGGRIHSEDPFDVEDNGEVVDRVIPWSPKVERPVRAEGWDCVDAALYAILSSNNLKDILHTAVGYGGDTDTVACIAMGIASVANDIEQNLPNELFEGLENRQFGHNYLIFVDQKLATKFPRRQLDKISEGH